MCGIIGSIGLKNDSKLNVNILTIGGQMQEVNGNPH